MLKSIKHFAKLCVFRGDPADVDGRTPTLVILVFILWALTSGLPLISVWMLSIESLSSVQTTFGRVVQMLGTICSQLFVALCIYVILQIRNVPQKFRQTFSSYLGVSIIIALFSLVIVETTEIILSVFQELSDNFDWGASQLSSMGSMYIVVSCIFYVATGWKIIAFGYILYKSIEVKFWHAGVVSIMVIYAPEILKIFSNSLGML